MSFHKAGWIAVIVLAGAGSNISDVIKQMIIRNKHFIMKELVNCKWQKKKYVQYL